MREQWQCRACDLSELEPVFSLGRQSLSGFLLPNQKPRFGPLDLVLCRNCSLVQLAHTYPGEWFYEWYGYRSGTNAMMVESLRELARGVAEMANLIPGDGVLDIGSNDGTLLRQFTMPLRLVGIDPVKNLGPTAEQGLHTFINDYFSAKALASHVEEHGRFRAVIASAMFYELEYPVAFLRDVRSILEESGIIAIQMNYLPSMIERNGYDNIVHEHQTYFSLTTLIPVLEAGGFGAIDVSTNAVNGGSFLVWCAPSGANVYSEGGGARVGAMLRDEAAMELASPATYVAFGRRIRKLRADLRDVIESAVTQGKKVYVYGASTRGLAIMEYCNLDADLIAGAAERNPDKWGRSYGATRIECVPEEEARAKADYFLVLPHHFLGSFLEREAEWLERGGRFLVPIPRVRLLGPGGVESEITTPLATWTR